MSKTTKSSSTSTVTPTNPAQVVNGLTGFATDITNLQNADPYSFTAGPTDLQTQGANAAAGLGAGVAAQDPWFKLGTSQAYGDAVSAGAAGASRALPYINDYLNPYLNDVVNSSLANYDKTAGQQQAQFTLGQAQDDTFGGSSFGLGLSNLLSSQGLDRAQLESGLRSQGWNTALSAAQNDAQLAEQARQRQLAAAAQEAQIANQVLNGSLAEDANARSNINSQEATGEALRQIQLQHNLAPLSGAGAVAGLWGQAPFGLLHGETQQTQSKSTSSDPLGAASQALGLARSLGAALSGFGLGDSIGSLFGGGANAAAAGQLFNASAAGLGPTFGPSTPYNLLPGFPS
jgi:hypothetical protein